MPGRRVAISGTGSERPEEDLDVYGTSSIGWCATRRVPRAELEMVRALEPLRCRKPGEE
jgi:hypothetical protein